jgi:glycosyltransferase involved in cell wall biosynthesis
VPYRDAVGERNDLGIRLIAANPGTKPPDISVVVSSYQRSGRLAGLFEALEAQTLDSFEVVIVDNGSSDDTEATLRKLVEKHASLNVKAVRVERNRGPAAGRNTGWRHATAPFVAFTDDDCLPQPQWLERGLAAIRNNNAVVAGMTIPEHLPTIAGPFSRTGYPENAEWLATCNVFYRKDDLELVGGFDERFETPAAEDTDIGWRIQRDAQRGFVHATDAVVEHVVWPSDFRASFREARRWYGVPYFISQHPAGRDLLFWRYFWKPSHPPALLATAALIAAPFSPYALAGTLPWLWYRLIRKPLPARRVKYRPFYVPGAFLIDLAEIYSMIRGSIRYRALVL